MNGIRGRPATPVTNTVTGRIPTTRAGHAGTSLASEAPRRVRRAAFQATGVVGPPNGIGGPRRVVLSHNLSVNLSTFQTAPRSAIRYVPQLPNGIVELSGQLASGGSSANRHLRDDTPIRNWGTMTPLAGRVSSTNCRLT